MSISKRKEYVTIMNIQDNAQFNELVKSMGLKPSQAIQIFMDQVIATKSIPFVIRADVDKPLVSSSQPVSSLKPTPEQKLNQKPERIYTLAEQFDVTGEKPMQIHLNGETRRVANWQGVLMNTLNMLLKMDNKKFASFENTAYFNQTFKSSQRSPKKLTNGEVVETNKSADAIMKAVRTSLNYYGWSNRFVIVLRRKK